MAIFSFRSRRFKIDSRRYWMACVMIAQATSLAAFEREMLNEDRRQSETAASAPNATQATPPRERADAPVPRTIEQPWMSLAEWRERHERQLIDPNRAHARIAFLGDSITQGWGDSMAFQASFGRYRPLNLGIGGDQTQHVLWRIEHGALGGVRPRLLVVLIGVNNLG
jgi:hypothetical protein